MRYHLLGKTGLYVSELCFGAMTFGGKGFWEVVGNLGSKEVESLVGTALDAGVNFVDTADVYSDGESEKLLGGAIKSLGRPREQLVVATKVRGRTGPGPNQVGLSRAHIHASIDGSLKRLGLDHVDLYQIHGFDPVTPIEETVRALDDVVRSGKVRYVGFSNLPAWYAMKAIAFADANGLARFQSAQVYYSIAGRDIEREMVPMAQDQKIAILPAESPCGRAPLGQVRPDPRARTGRRAAHVVRLPPSRPRAPAEGARGAQGRCPRRPVCVGGSRGARVAPVPSVQDERHHRREDHRATRRQPRGVFGEARARACEGARRGQRTSARVPGLDGRVPEQPRSAPADARVLRFTGSFC